MKKWIRLLAVTAAFALCGCTSTFIRNAANSDCERRVQADRERCLQNVQSSDEALLARKNARRDAQRAADAPTREELEAAEGKRTLAVAEVDR